MQTLTPGRPLVVATEEMTDEQLILHLNARHANCWRGTAPLRPVRSPEEVRKGEPFTLHNRELWLILHERLHRDDWSVGHVHEQL